MYFNIIYLQKYADKSWIITYTDGKDIHAPKYHNANPIWWLYF